MSMHYSDHAEQIFLKLLTLMLSSMCATMIWVGRSIMELNQNVALVVQRVAIQDDSIRNLQTRAQVLERQRCR